MSFHLENSHHQPKKPLNLLGGVSHDAVLVSTGTTSATLDLFDTKKPPPLLQFLHPCPPSARDTFLPSKINLKRSLDDHHQHHHHHHHHHISMSKRNGNNNNNNNVPKLDLKLNLSPPSSRMRANMNQGPNPSPNPIGRTESPSRSASVSPPSSCLSSEMSMNSPETTSMVLAGCPRCLMYVMLSEDDPKCPKCKSKVLLDFMHNHNNINNNNTTTNNSNSGSSKKMKKG